MARVWAVFLAGVLVSGCADKTGDTGQPTVGTVPSDGSGCYGSAPTIDDFFITSGVGEYEEDLYPKLTFTVDAGDIDGDLHAYTLSVWFDQTVDGSVAQEVSTMMGGQPKTAEEDECTVFGLTASIDVFLGGGSPAYDTEYEWGAIISDANGWESGMSIQVETTPSALRKGPL